MTSSLLFALPMAELLVQAAGKAGLMVTFVESEMSAERHLPTISVMPCNV